jgi:Rod binding domain-containing protein
MSDDDSTDPGKSTLDQLGMQAISSAISSGKGFGIGDMLVRSLLRSHPELTGGDPKQT